MPRTNSQILIKWIILVSLGTILIGSSVSSQPQDERLKQILNSPIISDFDDWVKKLGNPNYALNEVDIERGRVLAVNRRELFKELMSLSPKLALDHAVPNEVYKRMPAAIRTHLETPVSAYGDFMVYVVMVHQNHHSPEMMTGSRIEREVRIGTEKYRAFVYGRRENITTKLNIPLQGIILDGAIVVDEEPARKVPPSQYQAYNVDRAKVSTSGTVAEIGGKLAYFSSPFELEAFVRDQIVWEATIGPIRPRAGEASSPWTQGVKTVLFIRVDFPDRPGEPVDFSDQPLTVFRAQNLIDNAVSPFYENNSFNKTSLQTTVTPVLRMPQPQSFYFNDPVAIFRDGENAARSAGFDLNSFNLDLVAMSYDPRFNYGGVAFVGFRGAALNGFFDLRITAHELGHNYGLLHSNLWRTTDGSIIGPGSNVEYGNLFDVMGMGADSRAHFAANYKKRLDWLTDANVQVITEDGTYRVFAHDSTTPGGIRALKVRKNDEKNYWIEFRQLFTNLPSIMNGAIINWDYRSRQFAENQILDMSPASETVLDAPLRVGNVFHDTEDRIRITVLGKGNTTPESLDVKVEFNVGCTGNPVMGCTPVQITIQSNPVGRLVSIDDGPAITTPQVVTWMSGSTHRIATTSPQLGSAGARFSWSSWSDGGSISHSVTTPGVNTTYTANFTANFLPTMELQMEDVGVPSAKAAALDAVLHLRDPFPIVNPANLFNLGSDRNTRVVIFVKNLQLAAGEPPSAVTVTLVDSNGQTHNIAAENVWTGGSSEFSHVTFRLPNALQPGLCSVEVKLREQFSNGGTILIRPN